MQPGVRFIDEYPEIKQLFEKLFLNRELDEWYIKTCKQKLLIPNGLENLELVKDIFIHDNFNPSTYLYLYLDNKIGEGGFIFKQQVNLVVSKIVPVYKMDFLYSVKHNSLIGTVQAEGSPQETFEMLELEEKIREIFKNCDYIELTDYDLKDTVYDWNILNIDPFDRRLTLEYASFFDVLELCNEE